MATNDSENQKIELMSIQSSKFNRAKPAVWFQQIEAQIFFKGITRDYMKYCHALQSLDADIT